MDPMAAAHALVRALPADTAVVDEAITTGVYVRGFHHWTTPGRYFFCTGGGLGLGHAGGLRRLARHTVGNRCSAWSGDGSAMYSPQALWTAAAEGLPVVFAVVNNRQYQILKDYLAGATGPPPAPDGTSAWTSTTPPVDYVALATSMAVDATRVDHADDVGDAVRAALDAGRPHLLELPIGA